MGKIPGLGEKDRKILLALDIDCRKSDAEIGRMSRTSKQVVRYHVARLQRRGIIRYFATTLDPYKFGYIKFMLFLQLQSATRERISQIMEYLRNHDKTEWLATGSGTWDVMVGFITRDVYEFENALNEFLNRFQENIARKEVRLTTFVHHYKKKYLGYAPKYKSYTQGGPAIGEKFSELDVEILRWLCNNGRIPTVELAKRLGSTARTVKYRTERLRKKGLIAGNKVALDLGKIGCKFIKAMVYLKNQGREGIERLLAYCEQHPNITISIRCIAPWDLELEFEIESFEKFHQEMQTIKEKFGELIKNYEYVIVMEEHKLDYFPHAYKPLRA